MCVTPELSLFILGNILTRYDITEPEAIAAKLEEALEKQGSVLGGNAVDPKSVSVNGKHSPTLQGLHVWLLGMISKGSVEFVHDNIATSTANTAYIIGGAVAVGVLIIVFAIFAIIVFGVRSNYVADWLKLVTVLRERFPAGVRYGDGILINEI